MVQLELTHAQAEVLRMVLENYLTELRSEIGHTDSRAFRDKLKAREDVLRGFLEQLGRQEVLATQAE